MEAKDKTVVSIVRLDLAKHFLQGCYEIRKIKSLIHWLERVLMSAVYSPASLPSFLRVLKTHLFSRNFRIKE